MNKKMVLPIAFLMILFVIPGFVLAYSDSDTAPYSYGDEDTLGTGIANAAGDDDDGECRVYVDAAWIQTVAVAWVFGYDYVSGTRTWTVEIDASLQAYMSKGAFGYATILIYVALLDSSKNEIETLLVWQRDLTQTNPREFND
jgi:hypothetical protein